MNDGIGESLRKQVLKHMRQKGITQAELGRRLNKSPQTISMTLLYRQGITQNLTEVLEALDLELVAVPKGTDLSGVL